jgi:hypothetical protein
MQNAFNYTITVIGNNRNIDAPNDVDLFAGCVHECLDIFCDEFKKCSDEVKRPIAEAITTDFPTNYTDKEKIDWRVSRLHESESPADGFPNGTPMAMITDFLYNLYNEVSRTYRKYSKPERRRISILMTIQITNALANTTVKNLVIQMRHQIIHGTNSN